MTPVFMLLLAAAPPPVSGVQQAAEPAPGSAAALGEAYFLFLRGQEAEARGDVSAAVADLERASTLAPKAAEIRAELAGVYARQNRATDAVREAEAALDLDAGNYEAHRILGFVQAALADRLPQGASMVTQAIGHFEKALATGTRDPGMEITLGRLYVRNEQYVPAIRTLRNFLLLQPGYTEAQILLAQAYTGNGEPGEAVPVLEEIVAAAPDEPRNRAWLAELYEETGQWARAADAWQVVTTQVPRVPQYRVRLATALINAGELERGRTALRAFTSESPTDPMAWYLLSEVERRMGHADAAADAARRILAMNADDARGLLALAQAQTAARDFAGVVTTLEARVTTPREGDDVNGLHGRLAVELAAAYQGLGQRERAVQLLEDALKRAPDDGDLLFDLGAAYERAGQYDAAETAFRRVIDASPSHADALNYLGYMLAERGQKLDEALSLVRRALAQEPDNPSYLDSLGWAYYKLGRAAEAREPLERAAAARPKSSLIQDHVGDVYFELKQYRAAADAFERALDGDREGIDAGTVERKRDRARTLAGR